MATTAVRVQAAVLRRLEQTGRLGRYTLSEVARHNKPEDAWIAFDGKVCDITAHVLEHPGWACGCSTSQLLAILRVLGTDCTEECLMVHSQRALAQFAPFLIGVLVPEGEGE